MDFFYYIPFAIFLLWLTVLGIVQLIQVIKRGSFKRPEFSRENMKLLLEKTFPEDQRDAVLAMLDRYRMRLPGVVKRTERIVKMPGQEDAVMRQLNPETDNCLPLIAQIQMSILKIAHGDINIVRKYTENPEQFDYRDIIARAGYA